MSDFDKEAEREKLREQYERDKKEREATEQMSELLLKGATMTNAHCGTCGNPIFRYDGQEFCATCEEVVGTTDEETDAGDQQAETEGERADAPDRQSEADGDAAAAAGDGTDAGTPHESGADGTATPGAGDAENGATADANTAVESGATDATTADRSGAAGTAPSTATAQGAADPERTAPDSTLAAADTATTGDLAAAKAALTRTVTRLARQAEGSDDLDRTRAYLAATEDAADALAAVREADR